MTDTSVDDITLATTIDNTNPDYSHLQFLLDRLHTWITDNKITLNTNKTTMKHIQTPQAFFSLPMPSSTAVSSR
ncbi:hypothetical protein E2C01_072200 [Portunus trituberculatus]|uniref:Reverse transcriptase domain-containing protein n=1 Tax=Portunus trituberculatus TaxID=210409 RepID=A0A5B7I738_PORTR|nr:hypothetical protein [Portunus trituberculatus]